MSKVVKRRATGAAAKRNTIEIRAGGIGSGGSGTQPTTGGGRQERRATSLGATVRNLSSLEVAAEAEYAYIARDIRRIVRIGGGMIGLMFALWIGLDLAPAI